MPIAVTLTLMGDQQVVRTLTNQRWFLQDMRPAWEQVADIFAKAEKDLFRSQDRGKWPALSKQYARWKAQRYPGMPPMRRTDRMYRELTQRPFGIEKLGRWSMTIGTRLPYARIHQKGGWVTGWPPKRMVVHLAEHEKRLIVKAVQAQLVAASRRRYGTPAWGPPS